MVFGKLCPARHKRTLLTRKADRRSRSSSSELLLLFCTQGADLALERVDLLRLRVQQLQHLSLEGLLGHLVFGVFRDFPIDVEVVGRFVSPCRLRSSGLTQGIHPLGLRPLSVQLLGDLQLHPPARAGVPGKVSALQDLHRELPVGKPRIISRRRPHHLDIHLRPCGAHSLRTAVQRHLHEDIYRFELVEGHIEHSDGRNRTLFMALLVDPDAHAGAVEVAGPLDLLRERLCLNLVPQVRQHVEVILGSLGGIPELGDRQQENDSLEQAHAREHEGADDGIGDAEGFADEQLHDPSHRRRNIMPIRVEFVLLLVEDGARHHGEKTDIEDEDHH
mmetsp:Transcript_11643/g.29208  ORF Transcript_11643/g.29208 Transcript_11643/m.29208 type:complete len:333 (-) Transcript_11643:299-1297(-)